MNRQGRETCHPNTFNNKFVQTTIRNQNFLLKTDLWVVPEEEFDDWYRSSETIAGDNPYVGHLANKKWPLKKVLLLKEKQIITIISLLLLEV